ncbi:MAG: hypothetical protein LC687_03815 [Actinobacteria bacterium]|nr:hypothetical protein [Actinomycetota bacterium]
MSLTDAGKVIFEEGQIQIANWEQIHNKAARIHALESGKFQIGASSIPGTYLLPEALRTLQTIHPELNLSIVMDSSEQIIDKLLNYELDIAFAGSKPDDDRLEITCLARDRLIAVGKRGTAPITSFSDLKQHPLITYREGSGTLSATKEAISTFGGSYEDMNIVATVPNTAGALALATSGIGIAIVSSHAFDSVPENQLIPLVHMHTDRRFYAVQLKTNYHPLSAELIEHVQTFLQSER